MNRSVQLQNYVDSLSGIEFNWEYANCCHFVCKWVEVVTGRDPMDGLRKTSSFTDAARLIRDLGGSLESAFTKQLGVAPIGGKFAQVGDVVLVPSDTGNGALGICTGMDALCVDTAGGICRLDLSNATCAWHI